jgi:predicted Rossmann-fold nucleotide-binding protein
MDEFFEVATLIQTRKFTQTPLVCMGTDYWGGLFDWMRSIMLERDSNISPGDLDLIKVFDTTDEVVNYIREFYTHNKLKPNF